MKDRARRCPRPGRKVISAKMHYGSVRTEKTGTLPVSAFVSLNYITFKTWLSMVNFLQHLDRHQCPFRPVPSLKRVPGFGR